MSACSRIRAEYEWISTPDGLNDNVNQLKALARKLMGTPRHLKLLDGDTDVFGDGSVTLVSTPGHTPGSESLMVHLKNSGFIILSGDVVHLEENFEKDTVPSLNTNKAASIASMERVRRMIATYDAKFFINHDKAETDTLKLIPHSTIDVLYRRRISLNAGRPAPASAQMIKVTNYTSLNFSFA